MNDQQTSTLPAIAAGADLTPWAVAVALLKISKSDGVGKLALRHGFWYASSESEAIRCANNEALAANPGFRVALTSAKAVPPNAERSGGEDER